MGIRFPVWKVLLSFPLKPMASPMLTNQARTFTPILGSYPAMLSISSRPNWRKSSSISGLRIRAETMATEKLGIKVERNPPESKLAELGVRKWPKWGCPPSKFPWTYTAKAKCYLLEGKVKVYPDGHGDEYVEIGAGDFVEFPEGMKCTWDVSVAVDKHYMFE